VEVCGISAVYSVYRNGPRMLPCGTPDWYTDLQTYFKILYSISDPQFFRYECLEFIFFDVQVFVLRV
jgi:hypothetical protein